MSYVVIRDISGVEIVRERETGKEFLVKPNGDLEELKGAKE